MAASLVIGGSLYTAVNGDGDSDWERCYPYEHPEIFSSEPILEGHGHTCSAGWISLTKLLVLQGIRDASAAQGRPNQRTLAMVAAAELAHSVGGHRAWLAHHLRDLSQDLRNELAQEYGALLAMFRRPPGPQQNALLAWARPIIVHSQEDFPIYLIKAHLEQHLLLAWRFTADKVNLLLQAMSDAVPNDNAVILEWVACFLDERIATDILEHLDDETMHLLEDNRHSDSDI